MHERGRITEENHYYAYGLKIAGISSRKLGDANEGKLQNNYQYNGDASEYDEDIQWNDYPLRNYDPQIGRWVQQDPYQEFASGYVGMADEPISMGDPSGGSVGSAIAHKVFEKAILVAGTTLVGAFIGGVVDMISGRDDGKGIKIGASVGLLSGLRFSLGNLGNSGASALSGAVKSGTVTGLAVIANNAAVEAMQERIETTVQNNIARYASNNSYDNPTDVFDYYESSDAAALAWAMQYQQKTLKNGMEYSSLIFSVKGIDNKIYYAYTRGITFAGEPGRDPSIESPRPDDSKHFKPATLIKIEAYIHSHLPKTDVFGGQNENFSSGPNQDQSNYSKGSIDWYLVTRKGYLKVYRDYNGGI